MPYKKRSYRKRRRPSNRANNYVKYAGAAYTASKALSLAVKTARIVNAEVKFDETDISAGVSNSGTIYNLCDPAQGDGDNARDGNSIKLARLQARLGLTQVDANAPSSTVRLILFRGKHERGTSPTVTGADGLLKSADVHSPKDYTNRFSTKILMDRRYALSPATRPNIEFNISKKLFGHIQFADGTTGIENGGLYLLALSDEPTYQPSLSGIIRVSYYDN